MSLVEATIILMVLAILTAVIAPSAGDFISEARSIKAAEDVTNIGGGIMRLLRDTGKKCLVVGGGACVQATRADLLLSGTGKTDVLLGTQPAAKANQGANSPGLDGTAATPYAWAVDGTTANDPPEANRDTVDNQLVTNGAGYTAVSFTGGGGPRGGIGWRGAYVTGTVQLDPWGSRYQANTVFLGVVGDTSTPAAQTEGFTSAGWSHDAIVLSAGPNGVVETAFAPAANVGQSASGDDIIYVMKGSTR